MPSPAKPSTKPLEEPLLASRNPRRYTPLTLIHRSLPDIALALIDQAKSGNVAAIKLCFDLESDRDVSAELLGQFLGPALRAAMTHDDT